MSREPLLLEIGCEEIPARMIEAAAIDLRERLLQILDQAALEHAGSQVWATPRRLTVRVEEVQARQPDREELVLGPPAAIAFGHDGATSAAALGFAAKQGIDPALLERRSTEKGEYAGFLRRVPGRTVGELLSRALPGAVAAMSFPKTMRWGDGTPRWVRPVHWVLALHGRTVLPLELFGIAAGDRSVGHRFLGAGPVVIGHADEYLTALERVHVLADPLERRRRLAVGLARAASELDGTLVGDPALVEEVADLVEWPGAVAGRFDGRFLELPRELLVTTLRHHQKCFSVQDARGELVAGFVAVANTDRDPGSHVRRGNEWVIGGRLEDARFFWSEDLAHPVAERTAELAGVLFHAKIGTYADKARRMAGIAAGLAELLALDGPTRQVCREAAALAKVDLVSGTVGEFPELQGRAGGLLLAAAGLSAPVARAVYEHYQPVGPDDAVPASVAGAVLSVADKLDTVSALVGIGETPTGSRDPFALRRATSAVLRTVIEKNWPLSLEDLSSLAGEGAGDLGQFLFDRFQNFLRDAGHSSNEIQAVFRPRVDPAAALDWPLGDIVARLQAIATVRQREDFARLADLTKRVDNILTKRAEEFEEAALGAGDRGEYQEPAAAAQALGRLIESRGQTTVELERARRYGETLDVLAEFVEPVERFFEEVLVLDPSQPRATRHRRELLDGLRGLLTRCYDIRELAGQADRRTS